MGSIGAVVLIVLAVFPSVIGYQTVQTTRISEVEKSLITKIDNLKTAKSIHPIEGKTSLFQQVKENIENNWEPGYYLLMIFVLIWIFISILLGETPGF
jgi:hypothetical protein